jgi:hypothetical protein
VLNTSTYHVVIGVGVDVGLLDADARVFLRSVDNLHPEVGEQGYRYLVSRLIGLIYEYVGE